MIHADLAGKTHVPEDVLTSNCLGLLRLLPDDHLISFLGDAVNLDGRRVDLLDCSRVGSVEFWRWLPEGGQPDVIVELLGREGIGRLTIVIEVKHGAGKSGSVSSPEADSVADGPHEAAGVDAEDGQDQLGKYWRAATRFFSRPMLIYLTHHRSVPKDDLVASLGAAGPNAEIFWLSWVHLYRWVIGRLEDQSRLTVAEGRILRTVRDYLEAKGYSCFLGWPLLTSDGGECQGRGSYGRTYQIQAGEMLRRALPIGAEHNWYRRRYFMSEGISPIRSLSFYRGPEGDRE
jgi:hypothetical protein